MQYKNFSNIYLIGTSHVSKESIKNINKYFEEIKPEIIAVELDINRAIHLEQKIYEKNNEIKKENNKKKNKENTKKNKKKVSIKKEIYLIKEIGLLGYLLYKIGESLQNKYGDLLNINPGSDMYQAIILSKKFNLPLFFIDRDIKITLQRFSKKIKKREVLKIFFQILFSPLFSFMNKKNKKLEFDISKIPNEELIDYILNEVKKEFPSMHKVLIDERDLFMAKKLFFISNKYSDKKIFAVCGAGHIKGVLFYLEKLSKNHADIAY